MAAVKSLQPKLNSGTHHMLQDLVSPRERFEVPNHILDTQVFSKLTQNAIIKIQPSVVHFGGYKLNKIQKTSIKICNASPEQQNFHIIPPATKYFSIHYAKPDHFVPGFTIEVTITFVADEWRYYYDCIRIHCKGNENLVVPLHAFPVMDTSRFPRKLVFSSASVELGGSYSKILPLFSHCPIDFEFQITVLQSHPAFSVHPSSGVVPGEGETDIVVKYSPTEYVTANMTMQLIISQFGAEPLQCHVTASCSPTAARPNANIHSKLVLVFSQYLLTSWEKIFQNRSVRDLDELYKQTKLLDPRCISPVQIARKRQKSHRKSYEDKKSFDMHSKRFSTRLESQHVVNSILLQEEGKMKAKDLREAVLNTSNSSETSQTTFESVNFVSITQQMKEAAFESIVRKNIVEERANQLRWQVNLGSDPITDDARTGVLRQRGAAERHYKYIKRKDPKIPEELVRQSSEKTYQRTRRKANQTSKEQASFDLYKNKSWSVRHRALYRFQQAARTVLIRKRADSKIALLRKLVEDFRNGTVPELYQFENSNTGLAPKKSIFRVESQERCSLEARDTLDVLDATFMPRRVRPFTFPVYVSPDTKDDIAPDALGEVPANSTEVAAKRFVPFHKLVVPRYYELAGYSPHDVYDCLHNYVSPGLARPLRTGAEDEIISGVFALQQVAEVEEDTDAKPVPVDVSEEMTPRSESEFPPEPEEATSSSGLIPPAGLFKNPPQHRLYIFNPAPGAVQHYLPLPHSEVDHDYHLCPMPRYTSLPNAKKFLHHEDVIKGVMSWKKFSSHGLNSLFTIPTLTNVWLPRWGADFSQAMIPNQSPSFLTELPSQDEKNLSDEIGEVKFPLLTPEMVKAQFPTEAELRSEMETLQAEESPNKKDSSVTTSHYPTHAEVGISGYAPTARSEREELEKVIKNIYNMLGEKSNQLSTALSDIDIED